MILFMQMYQETIKILEEKKPNEFRENYNNSDKNADNILIREK